MSSCLHYSISSYNSPLLYRKAITLSSFLTPKSLFHQYLRSSFELFNLQIFEPFVSKWLGKSTWEIKLICDFYTQRLSGLIWFLWITGINKSIFPVFRPISKNLLNPILHIVKYWMFLRWLRLHTLILGYRLITGKAGGRKVVSRLVSSAKRRKLRKIPRQKYQSSGHMMYEFNENRIRDL